MNLCQDTKKLIAAAAERGIKIRGWDGTDEPEIGEGRISFNGDAATGQDHESMVINADPRAIVQTDLDELDADPKYYPARDAVRARYKEKLADFDRGEGVFTFCKTSEKDYDPVVCAVILRARHHNPTFSYSSDDKWDDWQDGADMCRKLWPDDKVKNEIGAPAGQRKPKPSPTATRQPGPGQRRQGKGVPTGGQFTSVSHSEADVSL